ncbi:hypothetical protein BKA62DRAFT_621497 [Auriculariales sp. MPI-PUGE-AT-0066]|nr:hypothetical protein BKA62DRAFT_621497 [Auriculariales sp. MPI-PUGE-AT-0066]
MSSPSAAQVIRLLQVIELLRPDILLWIGAGQFGILIASLFYGANLTQLYIYATAKRRDPTWVVLLVGWIFCLDTVHTGFIWAWLFEKTVLDAADITKTLLVFEINDALAFSVLLSGAIGASVQSFYAYRIARLARHSWFSILPWAGCLARVVLGVVVAITARKAKTLDLFLADHLWTLQGILAVGVGVDIYNTVVVCILLARQRDGMEITSTMISKLSLWTIETGSLTR